MCVCVRWALTGASFVSGSRIKLFYDNGTAISPAVFNGSMALMDTLNDELALLRVERMANGLPDINVADAYRVLLDQRLP